MISKLTLEAADALTVETTSALPNVLTYFFTWALSGDTNFKRAAGVFNDAVTTVIAAPGASVSVVIGSFALQNPNTNDATIILKIAGLEVVRCTLKPNHVWTHQGVYNENGQLQITGASGGSGSGSATLEANSTIAGLNPAYNTLAKLVSAIEALQVFKALNDTNDNTIVDTTDDNQNAADYVSLFEAGLQ
jgi:hypothetical protein